jgi:phage head maturation protease
MTTMFRLFGMAVPFGERTANPLVPGNFVFEAFARGAFNQQTLDDGWLSRLAVNHKRPFIEDAEISLHNSYAGIFFNVTMPRNAQARALMDQRASWRGVSIAFLKADVDAEISWPTNTRIITKVGFISHVSICVGDSRPAYSSTWVSEYSPAALERMKRENHEALERIYGADYRTKWPKENWDAPLQSTSAEAVLCTKDPERARRLVMPWGGGRLLQEYP